MTKHDDGGPAFPGFGQVFTTDGQGRTQPQAAWGIEGASGMTLRDWFAGQAMNTLRSQLMGRGSDADVAARCYEIADAMLAERAKGGA